MAETSNMAFSNLSSSHIPDSIYRPAIGMVADTEDMKIVKFVVCQMQMYSKIMSCLETNQSNLYLAN